MRRLQPTVIGILLIGLIAGCQGGVKEEQIAIKPQSDPLAEAKSILTNYANGQPMTSEVTSFPKLVEDLRQVDPAKADILEVGFQQLQKANPNTRPARAKEILKKLE